MNSLFPWKAKKTTQFFGFACALNVGRTQKSNHSDLEHAFLRRCEHYLRYELIYRFEHIVTDSSGKVVAK
jgi:hypothetical protein